MAALEQVGIARTWPSSGQREFQPGLFLTENGETLDLAGPSPRWRGMNLNPVTNGPLAAQWALLALVVGGPVPKPFRAVHRSPSTTDGLGSIGLPGSIYASIASAARRYWEASQSSARCR